MELAVVDDDMITLNNKLVNCLNLHAELNDQSESSLLMEVSMIL